MTRKATVQATELFWREGLSIKKKNIICYFLHISGFDIIFDLQVTAPHDKFL